MLKVACKIINYLVSSADEKAGQVTYKVWIKSSLYIMGDDLSQILF